MMKNEKIVLEPAPNGGWVVFRGVTSIGVVPDMIGAYTNSDAMLDALKAIVKPDKEGK